MFEMPLCAHDLWLDRILCFKSQASNMKDVLSHLHNAMDTEQDNYRFESTEIMDNLDTLDQNSNSSNGKECLLEHGLHENNQAYSGII